MSVMRRIATLSDEVKIASVSALCLMALVVLLKNVVQVSATVLSRDVIIYIIIYSFFWMLPAIYLKGEKRSRFERPLFLSLLIVTITVAIIALYAV
jgi:hypothetical protein